MAAQANGSLICKRHLPNIMGIHEQFGKHTVTMRDKRSVDELSIEELEKILAIRKREEREKRLDRMKRSGRVVGAETATAAATATSAPIPQIPGVTIPAVPDLVASAPVMT